MSEYNPQEYFDYVKSKIHQVDDKMLLNVYEAALSLIHKYKITGQKQSMKNLLFQLEVIERERELIKLGINRFVYRDDIDEYIDKVERNVVKVIELERYEREIPDEIVETIEKTKEYFDQLYVVFTDYTGSIERKVEKERRKKDPILFGTFQDKKNEVLVNRFYYLGDWIDDYCDLTLDKMVAEMKRDIVIESYTPADIEELKKQVGMLEQKGDSIIINPQKKPITFFDKVKRAFRL